MMLNLNTEETTDGRMDGSGLNSTPPSQSFRTETNKAFSIFRYYLFILLDLKGRKFIRGQSRVCLPGRAYS